MALILANMVAQMTLSYSTERNTNEDWFDLGEKGSNDKGKVKVKAVGEKIMFIESFYYW